MTRSTRSRSGRWNRLQCVPALLATGLLAQFPALAAQPATDREFPGIQRLMSSGEFAAAGLDRLTDAELAALDAWLLRYTAGEAEMLQRTNAEVREAAETVQITSRLQAPFAGWDGNTLLRLENGQVWRQRQPGRYRHTGDDLEVTIRRNFFGFHVLTVTSTGRSVGVDFVR